MSATKKAASSPKRCAAGRIRVVLFDEIEKAHPDVMNMLLQILEEGKITDNVGRKIDFRNTIIIMTSNVGAEMIKTDHHGLRRTKPIGEHDYDKMRDKILEEAKKAFKPEFMNRLDDIIVFHRSRKPTSSRSSISKSTRCWRASRRRKSHIELDEEAKEFLIEKGYDPQYGARPMRRAVERYLEDPLAEEILRGNIKAGDSVHVEAKDGKLTFNVAERIKPRRRPARSYGSVRLVDARRCRRLLQSFHRDVSVDLRRRKTGVA